MWKLLCKHTHTLLLVGKTIAVSRLWVDCWHSVQIATSTTVLLRCYFPNNVSNHSVARASRFRLNECFSSAGGAALSDGALGREGPKTEAWRSRQAMNEKPRRCRA